jgi:hypothetical protein
VAPCGTWRRLAPGAVRHFAPFLSDLTLFRRQLVLGQTKDVMELLDVALFARRRVRRRVVLAAVVARESAIELSVGDLGAGDNGLWRLGQWEWIGRSATSLSRTQSSAWFRTMVRNRRRKSSSVRAGSRLATMPAQIAESGLADARPLRRLERLTFA